MADVLQQALDIEATLQAEYEVKLCRAVLSKQLEQDPKTSLKGYLEAIPSND